MDKLRIIATLTATLMISLSGLSQQVPGENFYQINPFSVNPAAAGINRNISAYMDYRDQWSGLKGAPETIRFGLHGLVTRDMGVGLHVDQNNTGIFKQFSVDLDYSYRVALNSDEQSLSFGLSFGFFQNKINYDNVIIGTEMDPSLYSSNLFDEALVRTGFGVHYNYNDLNIHLASPLLYTTQEKKFLQNLYGLATYDFYLADNVWKVQPSVLYKYSYGSRGQADISVMGEWKGRLWAMAGYRTNRSILTGFGINFSYFDIGYAYEVNRSQLSSISSGSHGIVLYFNSPYSLTKKEPLYRSSTRRNPWN